MDMRLKPGMHLIVGDEWPKKDGGQLLIEEYSSVKLRPEEVPGAERVLEFLTGLLPPADSCWTADGWCVPILQGLRLIRDADGWRLETTGYLAQIVESEEAD